MTSTTAAAPAPMKQIQHDNSVDIQIPPQRKDVKEVVAQWRVPIRGKLYQIEFEHGTTSGKRVIWVDGKVSRSFQSSKATTVKSINFSHRQFQSFMKINRNINKLVMGIKSVVGSQYIDFMKKNVAKLIIIVPDRHTILLLFYCFIYVHTIT